MGRGKYDDGESLDLFWLEDAQALLIDFTLVPRPNMTLEQKMNTITRIVIVVWILLLVARYKHATLFLTVSLVIIALIYYAKKRHEGRIRRISKYLDESYNRHSVRSENVQSTPRKHNDDHQFMRFEAKSSNQTIDVNSLNNSAKQNHQSTENKLESTDMDEMEYRRLKAELKKQKELRKLTKDRKGMRKKNQEAEPVKDRNIQAAPIKNDPRRPWPPVVPFSMEVHAPNRHKETLSKSENREEIEAARKKNLNRAYLGGHNRLADSKFHGYRVEAFQDDESGEESSSPVIDRNDNIQEHYYAEAEHHHEEQPKLEEQKPAIPKRTFLPSNYDGSQEKPPVVKNENPKMTRHGAARTRRVPKWGDDNQVKAMHDASEMQFTRAAKLEHDTNTKGRINRERKSQVRSLFG